MRTYFFVLMLGAIILGGCSDLYTNKLLKQDTTGRALSTALTGSGEQLVRQKRIDDHVVVTRDHTELDVWVVRAKPADAQAAARGTVIILHGLNESKASFPYFGAAGPLSKAGFDVVLLDLRAHGRSGGKYITYGAKEKHDVQAVMNNLLRKKTVNAPYYVFGSNLGGAVAVQYAAIEPNVQGVVALAPYKDFASIANWQLTFIAPIMTAKNVQKVIAHTADVGDFDPAEASALRAAKSVKCPLLLVHGVLDLAVPLEQTQAVYEAAAGPKELLLVTPGPERAAMALVMEDWICQQIEKVASGKVGIATTAPASMPAN